MVIFDRGIGPREYAPIHIVSHKRSGATPDGEESNRPSAIQVRSSHRSVARQVVNAPGCAMISEPCYISSAVDLKSTSAKSADSIVLS